MCNEPASVHFAFTFVRNPEAWLFTKFEHPILTFKLFWLFGRQEFLRAKAKFIYCAFVREVMA